MDSFVVGLRGASGNRTLIVGFETTYKRVLG
jgi:hypothetical protein